MAFNVIIAGSRNFNDYDLFKEKCIFYLKKRVKDGLCIFSGCANGADSLTLRFAKEYGIDVEEYPAEWNKYGKKAGMLRNSEMLKNAHALIAFWDGKSKGTMNMVEIAKIKGIPVRIVYF
jgi:hypothetical protein